MYLKFGQNIAEVGEVNGAGVHRMETNFKSFLII